MKATIWATLTNEGPATDDASALETLLKMHLPAYGDSDVADAIAEWRDESTLRVPFTLQAAAEAFEHAARSLGLACTIDKQAPNQNAEGPAQPPEYPGRF